MIETAGGRDEGTRMIDGKVTQTDGTIRINFDVQRCTEDELS